ncbi:MAG: hypothetical protein K0S45_814 [Nitrospira sp.]|jgi:hypothetical protein|nr:hypothetical protein [Nitrospira sp.]
MIGIGQKVPRLRTPAFTEGALTLFDFAGYRSHWLAMCCMPSLGLLEAELLECHSDGFRSEGAILLALCPSATVFPARLTSQTSYIRTPMLADPLSRLHRLFGILREATQCCSILIDPSGVLSFRLTHDFNRHGMESLQKALVANRCQSPPLLHESHIPVSKGALIPCIL